MKKKLSHFTKGFTLLEILVVIGIIAILVGVTAVSYSTAQKKGRDARRKQDIRAIATAYEEYYSLCNSVYPNGLVGNVSASTAAPANCSSNATILNPVPTDPLNSGSNVYACASGFTCNTTQFKFCATLEAETTQFCISNQQ